MSKTLTKGNIIIEDIRVGDIIYEYETSLGLGIKSILIEEPVLDGEVWRFKTKIQSNGKIINYSQSKNYPHYGLNIYSSPVYLGINIIE